MADASSEPLISIPDEQVKTGMQSGEAQLVMLYKSLLRIVAHLDETQYSENNSNLIVRQTVEIQLDDPADPASEISTSQG